MQPTVAGLVAANAGLAPGTGLPAEMTHLRPTFKGRIMPKNPAWLTALVDSTTKDFRRGLLPEQQVFWPKLSIVIKLSLTQRLMNDFDGWSKSIGKLYDQLDNLPEDEAEISESILYSWTSYVEGIVVTLNYLDRLARSEK